MTFPHSGTVRLAWTYPHGATIYSRAVAIEIAAVGSRPTALIAGIAGLLLLSCLVLVRRLFWAPRARRVTDRR